MACFEPNLLKWRKLRAVVPEGVDVPMCFYGDLCKLTKSEVLGVYYGMRFFMCDNFEYDSPKLSGNMRPKWLNTEQFEEDKAHVEQQASSAREKRKKDQEEIRKRMEEIERQEAQEREAERERNRERPRRAKAAGPEAIRKGKYPCCTQ
ncbi:unnamed protein product [Urochloa humidicola]